MHAIARGLVTFGGRYTYSKIKFGAPQNPSFINLVSTKCSDSPRLFIQPYKSQSIYRIPTPKHRTFCTIPPRKQDNRAHRSIIEYVLSTYDKPAAEAGVQSLWTDLEKSNPFFGALVALREYNYSKALGVVRERYNALLKKESSGAGALTDEDTFNLFLAEGIRVKALIGIYEFDEAMKAADHQVKLIPNHGEGHSNRGLVFEARNQFQEAIHEHLTALEIAKKSRKPATPYAEIRNRLAKLYFRIGKMAEAQLQLKPVLTKDPNEYQSILTLAKIHFELNNTDDAVQLAELAVRLQPSNADGLALLADFARQSNSFEDAEELLECASKLDPLHMLTLISASKLYFGREQFDKALVRINQILSVLPNDRLSLLLKGSILNSDHKYNEALNCAEQVLKYHSSDSDALMLKGESLQKLGKVEEALEIFMRCIDLTKNTNDKNPYTFAFLALTTLSRDKQVVELAEKALEEDPSFVSAAFFKGRSLYYMGHVDEAERVFNQLLSEDPSRVHAAYFLVELKLRDGYVEAARNIYEKYLQYMDKETPLYYRQYISLLIEEKKLYAAEGVLEEAMEKFPNDTHFKWGLANLYLDEKRYDDAQAMLDQILEDHPYPARIYTSKATIYIQQEKPELALDACESAMANDPNYFGKIMPIQVAAYRLLGDNAKADHVNNELQNLTDQYKQSTDEAESPMLKHSADMYDKEDEQVVLAERITPPGEPKDEK